MTKPLPQPCAAHADMFAHFAKRVGERMGPGHDALTHWWRIINGVIHVI